MKKGKSDEPAGKEVNEGGNIHFTVKNIDEKGKETIEIDKRFKMSRSVFFKRVERGYPFVHGIIKYGLQKDGIVRMNHPNGARTVLEVTDDNAKIK